MQSGGSGDPNEETLDDMIAQALTFPELARVNPVVYRGIFQEYASSIILPLEDPPSEIEKAQKNYVLEELGRKHLDYLDLRADIDFVRKNPYRFDKYQDLSDEDWNEVRRRLDSDFNGVSDQINKLVNLARKCHDSIDQCLIPDEYYQLTEELPEIKGQNMVIRQMESQISELRQQVEGLKQQINHEPLKKVITADDKANYVGIGTDSPKSQLHISDRGRSVDLTIEADVDNSNKHHQPSLTLKQNGGQIRGQLGFVDGDNDLILRHNTGSSIVLHHGSKRIDLSGDKLTINGTSPFVVRKFGPFAGYANYDTTYSTDFWEALVGGFKALGGDINEDHSGDIIQVYTRKENGTWRIFADFRTHKDNEEWEVWILFIQKKLVAYE
jgi:hypothetical protein